jgi:copper chaperone NosL
MRGGPAARGAGLLAGLALALALACGSEPGAPVAGATRAPPGPEPIRFGEETCSVTGEKIERKRFGAELVARDGTVRKFRSAECLARYLLDQHLPSAAIESLWVVDFNHGTRLIDARSAIFLVSEKMSGPDDLNLLAVPDERLAYNLRFAYGGREARWDDVLALAEETRKNGTELCVASAQAPSSSERP